MTSVFWLKRTIENAIVTALHEGIGFEVDIDTSEVAVAAMVNKNGRRSNKVVSLSTCQ